MNLQAAEKNNNFVFECFPLGALNANCYLAYDKKSNEAVLIDPGAYSDEVKDYIEDKGITVKYTVNTHGHADHIAGNAGFGFPVLMHKLDEPCLSDASKNLSLFSGGTVKKSKAERLLADGDMIELGDIKLEVIHTPGHSPGGISLKYDNIIFTGDTLFFEGIGRTDLPNGDYDILIRSIKEKLFAFPDSVKVFPGHGPETTIGHEKEHNPFL